MLRTDKLVFVLLLLCCASAQAQTVQSLSQRSFAPGTISELKITGTDFSQSLRCRAIGRGVQARLTATQPTEAVVEVELAPDAFGPFHLLFAGPAGLVSSKTCFADSLAAHQDNGQNHSRETAQAIDRLTSLSGWCDGPKSDYFRLALTEPQSLSLEVITQALASPMDPIVRVTDSHGNTLALVDDGSDGPEPKFSVRFEQAGEYWLQVYDSRYGSVGAEYQLRVGDFPLVRSSYPLAVQQGLRSTVAVTECSTTGADEEVAIVSVDVEAPQASTPTELIAVSRSAGTAVAWVPIATSPYRQVTEEQTRDMPEGLRGPIGISGRLSAPGEVDSYRLLADAGQTFRFRTRTRSLGSSALAHLKLLSAAGAAVAETAVTAADEWSFDYAFAEAGEYRLEVVDLLRRGGEGFSYWIEMVPAGTFSVALKADAAVREDFTIQPESGAFAVDLSIARFGYDGPLAVRLEPPHASLSIVNPQIPAAAAEAKIVVRCNADQWMPNEFAPVQFVVYNETSPEQMVVADSRSLKRVKLPHVLASPIINDGMLTLVGCENLPPLFALEPATPLRFARPVANQTATLNLKRLTEGFAGGVHVLPKPLSDSPLPESWSVAITPQADTLTATFSGVNANVEQPETVPMTACGELNGRGQLLTSNLPVEWFDPLKLDLSIARPVIAGGLAHIQVAVLRDGDRQPVTLSLAESPAGVTLVGDGVIPADHDAAEITLQIAPTAIGSSGEQLSSTVLPGKLVINFNATSQFAGQPYSVPLEPLSVEVLAAPVELIVHPESIALVGNRSQQKFVVTGKDLSGQVRDWTREATLSIENPAVATLAGSRVLPAANGETSMTVSVGGAQRQIPVVVSHADTSAPIAFESEVLVALSKQGCNSGACHGSPSGKGGFRLSLRAFDPKLDELTLIREEFGRRINVFKPEASLLLEKPLMRVAHGGGKQLTHDDVAYDILKRWIAEGGRTDPPETPRVVKLEVYPSEKRVLLVRDGGQQLAVTARFADGTTRDVTQLASYESSDNSVAVVDVHGRVTPRGRGEAAILVRFLEHIESLPLMFIEQVEGFAWSAPPAINYIDELVDEKLQQLQFLPSEVCSDAEFLRRVHLDLIGVLPSVEETRQFLADEGPDKRQRLVDTLLERDEFAKFWALKWGDLLRITGKLVGDEGVYKYHRWVEEAFRENMPYDQFARELITASGSTLANPPANFYRTATDMNECVENISQVFLGARVQCAKCHNHPFERWTQDNYYGLGAFFNRVQRRTTERPGEMFVYTSASGDVTQPRTGQTMQPWVPQAGTLEVEGEHDRRNAFASWLVAENNPYFAKMEANRIWSHFFARGIVDPIDDFRDSNPPANAPLLNALAADFAASGFDRKQLIRVILASRTYQASSQTSEWNRDDAVYCSHQEPRLLTAEQLLDAINHTLALQQPLGSLPAGTKATQLPAPDLVKVDFLKTFGQPERGTVCACERGDDSNLSMAIELFNGPMMHEKLRDANNRFRRAVVEGRDLGAIIEELYLAALCRFPNEIERQTALQHCSGQPDMAAGLEDLCWALFNTDEFLFQH